jgi:TonB family protein
VKYLRTLLLVFVQIAYPQTAELEKSLERNPDDLATRSRLLALYEHAKDDTSRQARMRHLLWLITHHSDSNLFKKDITKLVPDDFTGPLQTERQNIINAWRDQLQIHPDDVIVYEHALRSLNQIDYTTSVDALTALRRFEPTNPMWAFLLAGLYEGALMQKDLSRRAAADLAQSTDLAVIGMTGQDLYLMGKNGKAEPLAQYGESLLKRAQELDPMNPRWAAANASKSPVLTEADMWPYGKVPPMPVPPGSLRVAPEVQVAKRVRGEAPVCIPTAKLPCPQTRSGVKLDVVIGKDGRVKKLHAPAGPVNLIPLAMDAVREWMYKPTVVDGQPVEVVTQVDAVFASAATATPAAAPPKPTGPITGPVPIDKPEPAYTDEAHKAGFTGSVLVALTVDETGLPLDVRVVRGAGYGLDQRAVEAVRRWTFKPAIRDGKPVAVPATVEVNFKTR